MIDSILSDVEHIGDNEDVKDALVRTLDAICAPLCALDNRRADELPETLLSGIVRNIETQVAIARRLISLIDVTK